MFMFIALIMWLVMMVVAIPLFIIANVFAAVASVWEWATNA